MLSVGFKGVVGGGLRIGAEDCRFRLRWLHRDYRAYIGII